MDSVVVKIDVICASVRSLSWPWNKEKWTSNWQIWVSFPFSFLYIYIYIYIFIYIFLCIYVYTYIHYTHVVLNSWVLLEQVTTLNHSPQQLDLIKPVIAGLGGRGYPFERQTFLFKNCLTNIKQTLIMFVKGSKNC